MEHETFNAEELTAYLHLATGDVERLLRESDLPHETRGGRVVFRRGAVDAWASQRILNLPGKRLDQYHEKTMRGTRDIFPDAALIPELLDAEYIDLALPAKTKASVIREMVALADKTTRVLDARELLESVVEREELCSTALPGGFALLHARHHAPYRFEGSFITLGRTLQDVHFSAPDGRPTRLFFLICCQDDRIHLHTLARLCLIAMKTHVMTELMAVESAEAAFNLLLAAEREVLPAPSQAPR